MLKPGRKQPWLHKTLKQTVKKHKDFNKRHSNALVLFFFLQWLQFSCSTFGCLSALLIPSGHELVFISHSDDSLDPGHHLPVWSHHPFPNPDNSGWIYSDSVFFSVHHQRTCTARVQVVLKREKWRESKIRSCLKRTHFAVCHCLLYRHSLPEAWDCTFTGQLGNTDIYLAAVEL